MPCAKTHLNSRERIKLDKNHVSLGEVCLRRRKPTYSINPNTQNLKHRSGDRRFYVTARKYARHTKFHRIDRHTERERVNERTGEGERE